jgi:hypothetical protein
VGTRQQQQLARGAVKQHACCCTRVGCHVRCEGIGVCLLSLQDNVKTT